MSTTPRHSIDSTGEPVLPGTNRFYSHSVSEIIFLPMKSMDIFIVIQLYPSSDESRIVHFQLYFDDGALFYS